MKRAIFRFFLIIIAYVLTSAPVNGADAMRNILVIDNGEAIYDELLDGIRAEVATRHIDNVNFVNLNELLRQNRSNPTTPCTLLIPVGTKSTKAIIENSIGAPILSVAIPRTNYQTLLKKYRSTKSNQETFTAIFLDQPISRRVALLHEILPNAKRIAVLLGASSINLKDELEEKLQRYDYSANIDFYTEKRNLVNVLDSLLEDSDAMLGMADPTIFNPENAQNILLTAYRWRVPLIGLSPAYVRAGSLAAVYTTAPQFAAQAIEAIESEKSCHKITQIQPQHPKYFEVKINYRVAEAIGLVIDSQDRLHAKVKQHEVVKK
ncbi:MAG: ABC transporter substrate binding protein [Candidatus Thiodiazotropha sp.]|jgi:putative tryptophan/tyrosine transport system substrate-binding protein